MHKLIELIPAVKRLELRNVGCWESLDIEFLPGLNIITEEGTALGKTTIFKAILHSLTPMSPLEYRPTPTIGRESGTISVEFMFRTLSVPLRSSRDALHRKEGESSGAFVFRQLKAAVQGAPPGMALLIDEQVTALLDSKHYRETMESLDCAPCQVLCQIAHCFELEGFPDARVYACHRQERDTPGMKLRQSGRGA